MGIRAIAVVRNAEGRLAWPRPRAVVKIAASFHSAPFSKPGRSKKNLSGTLYRPGIVPDVFPCPSAILLAFCVPTNGAGCLRFGSLRFCYNARWAQAIGHTPWLTHSTASEHR